MNVNIPIALMKVLRSLGMCACLEKYMISDKEPM